MIRICNFWDDHKDCDKFDNNLENCRNCADYVLKEHDAKIRAEAIDEYLKLIKQHEDITGSIDVYKCENIAEQMKERNNE